MNRGLIHLARRYVSQANILSYVNASARFRKRFAILVASNPAIHDSRQRARDLSNSRQRRHPTALDDSSPRRLHNCRAGVHLYSIASDVAGHPARILEHDCAYRQMLRPSLYVGA